MLQICSRSLEQEIYQNCLKKGPFSQGREEEKTNYRPISIPCSFGKILEKYVSTQLENYLNEKNILPPHQFRIRRGISVENAVQNVIK